jgi:class 3 adenylate cyclase
MPTEVNKQIELEIAYALFIDIVGYSKPVTSEQRRLVELLNQIVRQSEHFRAAEAKGDLITVPTGDGMALVFYNALEAPVECALEVSRAASEHPELQLRMGIHSGPVSDVVDVSGRSNIAGAGINIAQRVMDCGDAGHILVSKHMAEDLEQYGDWKRHLHDLGECEVKHGIRVPLVNLYTEEHGNPEVPQKFRQARKVLSVAHWEFEPRQTTPEGQAPFFKRKIRIVLRNDASKEIEVKTPDWATDAGDLAIQPSGLGLGAASKIRLENKQTGGWKQDKWLEEADQLIVPPAHHFEAWVGLNHQYTDKTLQRHVREGRIGTLVFFVLVEGQKRKVSIRVT